MVILFNCILKHSVIPSFFNQVRIYNRKYKELTKAELELFVAGDPSAINPDLGVDDQAELLPYNREFEFPRERLKMGKQVR